MRDFAVVPAATPLAERPLAHQRPAPAARPRLVALGTSGKKACPSQDTARRAAVPEPACSGKLAGVGPRRLPTHLCSPLQQPECGPSAGLAVSEERESPGWEPAGATGTEPRSQSDADAHPHGESTAVPSAPRPGPGRDGRRSNLPPPIPTGTSASRASRPADVTSSNNSRRQSCPGRSRGGGSGGLGLPAEAPSLGLSPPPDPRSLSRPARPSLGGGPGSSRRRLEPSWHR